MERHGPDAKVIVLPFARYQLPRNAIRMDAEAVPCPQEVQAVGDATGRGSGAPGAPRPTSREIRGSTTIVELLRRFPDGEAARLCRGSRGRARTAAGPSTSR